MMRAFFGEKWREVSTAQPRLMDCSGATALVRLSVRVGLSSISWTGSTGADYTVPVARIKELNRNIVGEIEMISRRAATVASEI
jgi:hypothetical protein